MVPLVDLRAQYEELQTELHAAALRTFDEVDYILGREVERFEEEFAEYCGTLSAVGVSTGLAALRLALECLELKPGDEVITPANTFVATVLAIRAAGGTPVLVDVDEKTMNIDPQAVAAAITPRTKIVMPVHLYGHPADMAPLQSLARKHDLKIVEDASQAHGATYHGQKTGSFGAAGCFSLYPTKNLGAIGDGGIVTTNSAELKRKLRARRNYGMAEKYQCTTEGSNERLDTIQAAFLRVKLPHLDSWNDRRRQHAAKYNDLLADLPLQTPVELPGCRHVYYVYVIRTDRRDSLQRYLTDHGIVTGIHYPVPIHKQPAFAREPWAQGPFPVTERLAYEILSLPMYPHLSLKQVQHVASTIRQFFDDLDDA